MVKLLDGQDHRVPVMEITVGVPGRIEAQTYCFVGERAEYAPPYLPEMTACRLLPMGWRLIALKKRLAVVSLTEIQSCPVWRSYSFKMQSSVCPG